MQISAAADAVQGLQSIALDGVALPDILAFPIF
jgi:hypothetical protein